MRKTYGWLAVAGLIAAVVLVFAFLIEKVEVAASGSAAEKHGWVAYFSSPLAQKAITDGIVFVADRDGKRVEAKLALEQDGKQLRVQGLAPGKYTLHVEDDALSRTFLSSLKQNKLDFTVYQSVHSVTSAEELKSYFEHAKAALQKGGGPEFYSSAGDATEESSDKASSGGSADHSTTNHQVDGVDEGDLVKTDGDFIYSIIDGSKVAVTDIRRGKLAQAAFIDEDQSFYPSQLYLHGKMLIIVGDRMMAYEEEQEAADRIMPLESMTAVLFYDVSDPEKPVLVREIRAEGYMNSSRKTDDTFYLVTNMHPRLWAIDEIEGDAMRPRLFDSTQGESYMAYSEIGILPGSEEPSYTIVTSIDLGSLKTGNVETKGYLGSSGQLYMSKENLYLTAVDYGNPAAGGAKIAWNPGDLQTQFFKFSLDGTKVKFTGSSAMKGMVLNQFSMDEHDGHFRVVMTEGEAWNREGEPSKNHLYILDETMSLTGSVKDLAKGERIYSARFMGDKAYMVTFRETDPLFVIDVADPAKPEVLGELKIPGFSNYLHPLGENHLIGFGYETEVQKNPSGGEPLILTGGMKISLFDITDFANPKEADTEIIGGRGTYSPIQYDHKALLVHPGKNLFGFPVSLYDEKSGQRISFTGSGAAVYEISPEKGIVLKGDLIEKPAKYQQYEEWETQIQRLVYSGGRLFTIAPGEINSYDLATFKKAGQLKMK